MSSPPATSIAFPTPVAWRMRGLAVACALFATIAVIATYPRLSQTYDEPLHLATGLEWLQYGSALLNTENPPIARAAVAMGPYLAGARLPPLAEWDPRGATRGNAFALGNEVLYRDGHYTRNLTAARLGIVPFLWLMAAVVWLWAGGDRDPVAAAMAVAATVFVPAILSHAGFATTDIAFVAMFLTALYGLCRVVTHPGRRSVVIFSALLGLSMLTKFSTFVFFGPAAAALALAWGIEQGPGATRSILRQSGWTGPARMLLLSGVVVGVVVWAGYGFSFGRIGDLSHWIGFGASIERNGVLPWWATVSIPAPELAHGFLSLRRTVSFGHRAYLFGEFSQTGFWRYYPVTIILKSTIPFLIFAVVGVASTLRRARQPGAWPYTGAALAALGIVAINVMSPLNYGIRHVLIVYPLIAIAAAWGWRQLIPAGQRWARAGLLATVLLAGQAAIAGWAFPDYLSYFNAFAGSEPGQILVETDLDWGQDFLRANEYLRANQVQQARLAYFGSVLPCRHDGPEFLPLEPGVPATGWIVISEVYAREIFAIGLKLDPCDEVSTASGTDMRDSYSWLARYEPVARIGGSIRVYHIVR